MWVLFLDVVADVVVGACLVVEAEDFREVVA
jgi:hypothetical protein